MKIGVIGSFDSQELIQRLLGPRGWAMGWAGGQFRLFSRPQALRFEDATVTVSPDDFASDDVPYVEEVELTPMAPKERFKITYGEPLVSEAGPENEPGYSVRALDPGAKVRHSNAELEIDGQGLIPTELWQADPNGPASWRAAFAELWSTTMATWYAAPHVLVKSVPVLYSKGKDIGVGTVVRFSSHFAPSREGAYGLSNRVGRVYRVVHNLQDLTTKLGILIQPGDPLTARRWAPIAAVVDDVENVEDRYDPLTRTFTCYSNYFAHGNETGHDLRYFVEPEGLGVGGNALLYGYQWDGRQWSKNFEFTVESVDLSTDTIVHSPGSFSGTFYEAMYTVLCLAPYDDQPASSWPRAFFSVHTRSNFHFGAGPTKGFKLS